MQKAYIVEQMYTGITKSKTISVPINGSTIRIISTARSIIRRVEIVRTPKHNIAEAELSILTRQGLKMRTPDRKTLENDVWFQNRNEKHNKVDWQFTTKDARIKLKRQLLSVSIAY